MHPTARQNAKWFFAAYAAGRTELAIAEIGSQDVNGSLRDSSPPGAHYVGLDFIPGKGVDLVLTDPYALPLPSESQDIVVSSSCFEHSQMFWLVFLEILRILKSDGVFYINAPSNGPFHRYPVDCWRFYPDAAEALAAWGRRSGYQVVLLESYTTGQSGGCFNDFVAIYLKDEQQISKHPTRVLDRLNSFTNGRAYGDSVLRNHQVFPEDQRRLGEVGLLK